MERNRIHQKFVGKPCPHNIKIMKEGGAEESRSFASNDFKACRIEESYCKVTADISFKADDQTTCLSS